MSVYYGDLINDSNFLDDAFKKDVEKFRERMMPGMPLGLLNTDNFELWGIIPDSVHSIHKVAWEDEGTVQDGWAIRNDNTMEWVDYADLPHNCMPAEDSVLLLDQNCNASVWNDEDEANEALEHLDQDYEIEHGWENRLAIPWGHSWFTLPDGYIDTDDLRAAGFTVATYKGEYRLAGIDGVGYSHEVHYAKLYALHCVRHDWEVATDKGPAKVYFEQPPLVQMARAGE